MAIQASVPLLHGDDAVPNSSLQWGMMDGGGGLPQNDLLQSHPHHGQQQTLWVPPWSCALPPSHPPGLPPSSVAASSVDRAAIAGSCQQLLQNLLERQRKEMDLYVCQESNRIMAAAQQQQKQQLAAILASLEAKATSLLRQKDSQVAKARERSLELELCLRLTEEEKERWERVAMENEAIAISLNNTLEQLREPHLSSAADGAATSEGEREASCSGCLAGAAEASTTERRRCRVCVHGEACAVLLPCRHFCCCAPCAASVELCPLCASPKRSSVEVFLE